MKSSILSTTALAVPEQRQRRGQPDRRGLLPPLHPLDPLEFRDPVYTFIEPTSYYRARKDVEEMVYMDQGPDWHLRGFEAASDQAVLDNPLVSSFHLQAMGGIELGQPLFFR